MFRSIFLRLAIVSAAVVLSSVPLNAAPTVRSVIAGNELGKVFTSMNPAPGYPLEAQKNGWSGSGTFLASVDAAGKVTGVRVVKSTGHRVMDDAVTSAVMKWRAKTGTAREVEFPVEFQAPPKRAK